MTTNTLLTGSACYDNFQQAARSFAALTAGMLGPRRGYKLVVPSEGDFVVTRDCHRLLQLIEVDHPIGRLVYSTADGQATQYGDGVVTAVFLASVVLDRCYESVRDGTIHPRDVYRGLDRSRRIAEQTLEEVTIPIDPDPTDDRLQSLTRMQIRTAFDGDAAALEGMVTETLAGLATDARPSDAGGYILDTDSRVHVFARRGHSRGQTRRFDGVVIKTAPLDDESMPIRDARVATVDQKLYLETLTGDDERSRRYAVSSPAALDAVRRAEETVHERLADPIVDAGVDVLVTRKGIDDRISNRLTRDGVVVVRRAKPESILESVAAATGATVVGDVSDLSDETVGSAGRVDTLQIGPLSYTVIDGCENGAATSILARGGTWTSAEDTERGLEAVLRGSAAVVREPAVVPGGGYTEAYIARRLRSAASGIPTRDARVVETVAEAFETIVRTLANNSGLDPLAVQTALRARIPDETAGVVDADDVSGATVDDVTEAGIFDATRVKRAAVTAALQTAMHAVPIDAVIAVE